MLGAVSSVSGTSVSCISVRCGRVRTAMGRAVLAVAMLLSQCVAAAVPGASDDLPAWFEAFKASASDEQLYRFLYAMPKGGDLHNHLSGSIRSEWFFDLALAQESRGYRYYTRVAINNCRPYGGNAFVDSPYLLMFVNIQESRYRTVGCLRAG